VNNSAVENIWCVLGTIQKNSRGKPSIVPGGRPFILTQTPPDKLIPELKKNSQTSYLGFLTSGSLSGIALATGLFLKYYKNK